MAVQMKAYTPTASQIASAQAHIGRRGEWRTVHIENVRYFVMPSSCATSSPPKGKRKRVYYVRVSGPAYGCDCPYYETGHAICSHILAAKEAINHDILAAWVADQDQDRAAGKRYEDLVPTCQANGCDEDPEPHSDFCFRHQLVDAF